LGIDAKPPSSGWKTEGRGGDVEVSKEGIKGGDFVDDVVAGVAERLVGVVYIRHCRYGPSREIRRLP